MKKLVLVILFSLFGFNSVYATGTVSITKDSIYINNIIARKIITLSWIGDVSDGTVPSTTINATTYDITGWYLYSVETNPGSVAPTDNYDIVINDADGLDISGGMIINRDTVNTELVLIGTASHGFPIVRSNLTFVLTNQSVHSATGTVILTFISQ